MKCTDLKIAVYSILVNVHSRGTQAPNTEIEQCYHPRMPPVPTSTIPLTLIKPHDTTPIVMFVTIEYVCLDQS